MAGPFCGQVLADMGADVIKVEPPEVGDQTRRSMGEHAFRAVNRNKRSITLNLKDPSDVAVLHRLVATADVLTENFRPGVADRLGAGWEELHALNPRLIYASISGFGQTGPYAQRPGLRPDRAGRRGRDERHRRAGRRSGQVRRARLRPLGGAVLRRRHPLGAWPRASARGRASGSTRRCGRARWRCRSGRPPSCGRPGDVPRQARLRAPADRSLPGAEDARWLPDRGRQQPEAVDAAVRDDRAARAGRDERFATNADRMARRPELVVELEAALAARTTDGVGRDAARRGRPRRPDPRLRRGGRGPAHPRP